MRNGGYVLLTFRFHEEGNRWVGLCEDLGTSTFGDTLDEVKEALADLVGLHLNELEAVNERPRFFREHKIPFYRKKPALRRKSIPLLPNEVAERRLLSVSC